jgi:hypothetical protein
MITKTFLLYGVDVGLHAGRDAGGHLRVLRSDETVRAVNYARRRSARIVRKKDLFIPNGPACLHHEMVHGSRAYWDWPGDTEVILAGR